MINPVHSLLSLPDLPISEMPPFLVQRRKISMSFRWRFVFLLFHEQEGTAAATLTTSKALLDVEVVVEAAKTPFIKDAS